MDEYFGLKTLELIVRQPLELTETVAKYEMGTWNNHDDCDRTTYFDIKYTGLICEW